MSVVESKAEAWNVSLDAYHADTSRISHSMLECFRRSQRRYHGVYVTGLLQRPAPTEAMQLGSLAHLAVLEPERWASDVIVAPKCDRRTKEGKATWARFCGESAGRTVVTPEQRDTVSRIAEAVYASPVARRLLEMPGVNEHSIYWRDEETGLYLKSRRDRVCPGLLLDLKTARDVAPEAFAKAATNLGYARQAAHYLDGEMSYSGRDCSFVFIAVESDEPHTVACYELDDEALSKGTEQNRKDLGRLKECMESGQWAAVFEREIVTLGLPRWAGYSDEWETN